MSENCGGRIISAEDLARIQAACRQRAAELEAAREALFVPPSIPPTQSEAERFVAAVETMPANVWRFFQAEDPTVSPKQ